MMPPPSPLPAPQSAWLLGPKGCGPNVLVTRSSRAAACAGSRSGSKGSSPWTAAAAPSASSSLFDVPQSQVVRSAKHDRESSTASEEGGGMCAGGSRRWVDVALGTDRVRAAMMGGAPATEAEAEAEEAGRLLPAGLEHVVASIESGVVAGADAGRRGGTEPQWA